MGALKAEKYPIQILSLSAIKVDHALQSRVSTSVEYQREFSEAMLRGDEFPAITVFLDDKGKYWLADGFHRYGARKTLARSDRKFDGIRAEVRSGSRGDAIVFSAGANQKFSIPRTPADIRKAVEMLLRDAGWLDRSSTDIAKHVGCSSTTVNKYRVEYCNTQGIPVPTALKDSSGRVFTKTPAQKASPIFVNNQKKCTAYFMKAQGDGTKGQYLSTDRAKAEEMANEILRKREESIRLLQPDALSQYFMHRGLTFKGANFNPSQYPKLSAYVGHGHIYVSERFERRSGAVPSGRSFAETVGCLLLSRAKIDPSLRPVVVCYPDGVLPSMLDLGRQLGIEFLTPDEFVASLKGDGSPTP